MAQEGIEHLAQIQEARLAVYQRHHVDAEAVLHLRQRVQVIEHDLRDFAAFQFDDRAHAGLVGFVADLGNAFEPLVAHQFADLDQQVRFIYLIRQLVDDDGLAVALLHVLDVGARAHDDATATGA